jgi:hypothetical protein
MFLMAVSFVLVALLYICVCVKCRRRAHESFVLVILILIVNHDFLRLAHYIHIWITNLDGAAASPHSGMQQSRLAWCFPNVHAAAASDRIS